MKTVLIYILVAGFPNWKISNTEKPVTKVRCAKSMKEPLLKALKCIKDSGNEKLLRTYDGCYNYRNIRGSNRLSNHAYGIAIDINAGIPQPMPVVKCFKRAGFAWGGDWTRPDPMHFELVKEKN